MAAMCVCVCVECVCVHVCVCVRAGGCAFTQVMHVRACARMSTNGSCRIESSSAAQHHASGNDQQVLLLRGPIASRPQGKVLVCGRNCTSRAERQGNLHFKMWTHRLATITAQPQASYSASFLARGCDEGWPFSRISYSGHFWRLVLDILEMFSLWCPGQCFRCSGHSSKVQCTAVMMFARSSKR